MKNVNGLWLALAAAIAYVGALYLSEVLARVLLAVSR